MIKQISRQFLFIVVIVHITATLLFSLDPQKQLTQYIHKKWTSAEGLPNNSISCILQTADGYLWIGTEEGLARFDGVKFEIFNKENTGSIKDNRFTVLYESSDHTLWIGTRGGLLRYKNQGFKSWVTDTTDNKNSQLLHKVVNALQEDDQGNLWVGFQEEGISVFKKGALQVPTHPEALAQLKVVYAILKDRLNPEKTLIGTKTGLFLFTNGKLQEIPLKMPNGRPPGAILSLIADDDGNLWVGTDKNGVICCRCPPGTSQWETTSYNTKTGLMSDYINSMSRDGDKNLWIGTESGGLHRLTHGHISVFRERDGLSNDSVNCLYEDREGNLWVGTLSGLNLFMNGKFTNYTETEGLLDNVTWTVYEDSQKKLWITTNDGLNCFQKGIFTFFTRKDGLSSDYVSCTCEDRQGNLWIGTYDRGVNRLNRGGFSTIGSEVGLEVQCVRAIYEDSQGTLWVGSYGSGLFKRSEQESKFTSISTKNGLSSDYILAIYEDRNGGIWIGTDGAGLNYLHDGKITVYSKTNGLSANTIFTIFEDRETPHKGTFWIGTDGGGLNYLKNETIIPISLKEGLKDNTIYQLIEDGSGFFWMGGHKGISRIRKQELYDFVAKKIPYVTVTLFGKADGIKGGECSGSFQPAGCKTSDGTIWFPTTKGIVAVNPDNISINVLPPPVHIEEILIDGKPTQWEEQLVLEPGFNKIEILYTALSLADPRNVKFRYILEGFEKEWNTPTDRKDRIAIYTNLSPGTYTFRVTACNNDGIRNEQGESLAITVKSPFWLKWWFILLAVIGFSLLSYVGISALKRLLELVEFWRTKNYIGQYRVIEQIGTGGMANIFKVAAGKGSKKKYLALKLMKEELIFDAVYRQRFLEEGQIIDSLDHPHIVNVFERGEHNHNPFIAMELLEGHTLDRELQQKGVFSPREALDIILQILEAISAIHRLGIIHRDLKPGNIMLIKKGEKKNFVKILDFGLAKVQTLSRVTESGMVIGTLSYLSPEQLLNSQYSPASDIYALGVIFYEMLTGQKPYNGETPLEIMQQIFKTEPPPPNTLRKDIPAKINSIILSMMDKKPGLRPSIEVLVITLQKLASGA